MQIVGLLTARGGSKGLPRKNILPLAGKPLLAWSIQAALASSALTRLILSTDDAEIAQVGAEWGAEVPFLRPAELAQDHSDHLSVVLHALDWLEQDQGLPDYLLLLQPTSPLRRAEDIDAAAQIAQKYDAKAVISVTEAATHPYLTQIIGEKGTLQRFLPAPIAYLQRQALPPVYALNGAIYLLRPEVIRAEKTLLPEGAYPYVMPPERALDVDSAWDLKLADWILQDADRT